MLIHPRRASREIIANPSILPSFLFVLVFACALGLAYLVTYLNKSYPPSPTDWQVWINTWGGDFFVPYIPVPLESYHLFLAIAIVPGMLLVWVAIAGAGRLISLIFHGKVSFSQYLKLFAFSFILFWLITAILDFLYMGFFGHNIVPALQMAYGPLARTIAYLMPLVLYPLVFALGGVYTSLATYAVERFSLLKCVLTGLVTVILALLVLTVLVR